MWHCKTKAFNANAHKQLGKAIYAIWRKEVFFFKKKNVSTTKNGLCICWPTGWLAFVVDHCGHQTGRLLSSQHWGKKNIFFSIWFSIARIQTLNWIVRADCCMNRIIRKRKKVALSRARIKFQRASTHNNSNDKNKTKNALKTNKRKNRNCVSMQQRQRALSLF